MISVRGGAGLGDAIYLQSVSRRLLDEGHDRVEVCSRYADVFLPLGARVMCSPFRRKPIDRLAHYATRRGNPETTQFEDCCISAGVAKDTPLRLDWLPRNRGLVDAVRAGGRPVIAVGLPRSPFGDRPDQYGKELLPRWAVIQDAIDRLPGSAKVIQIGAGKSLHEFSGLAEDYANRTSVSDLLDIASACDAFLGYVSFLVPLAEAMGKPGLFIWSRRGLGSGNKLIRQITPTKVFHGSFCRAVVDDSAPREFEKATDAFCDTISSPVAA